MLALSEAEEKREMALYKRNASTVEDVQRKQALRQKDAAQVEADKASLDQARADYESNVVAAKADVAGAKAHLLDAQIDLSYCRMSSPIDGRIGLAEVKVGNLVGPGTAGGGSDYTELAVVRQLNPMGVEITVSSRYLDRLTPLVGQGLPIEVFRPGLEGEEARRFRGKATVIDNTINASTSTFLVRAEVANATKTLLPGEYVKVNARVGEVRDAIVVPEQAVIEMQAGPTVYTVDKEGKVASVGVRASFTYEGLRVLESGLQPGQQVIVEGMQMVRGGMAVKTQPAALDASAGPKDQAAPTPEASAGSPGAPKATP
jgi:RND family efflux transporter MFP subunit